MYARIMKALNDRRAGLKEDKGFTLIELLVVVIIIGILAAIAIPIYIGVQNNAKDSAVKTDVANLKTAIVSLQTNGTTPAAFGPLDGSGTTPASFPDISATSSQSWSQAGATLGVDTTALSWGATAGGGFCIIGVSVTTNTFYATDSNGVSTTACTIA